MIDEPDIMLCELPPNAELDKPFRNPTGSGRKFSVYTKNESGDVVKVSFGDPDMEIRRDDPVARKAFRDRFSCDTDPGPKWKAKYWSCRMWDEETVSELTATNRNSMKLNRAIFSLKGFDGTAPDEIVFVPAGTHKVNASVDGKPSVCTVTPTEFTASLLNQKLQDAINESLAGNMSRPFLDFQHEHGRAAAHPVEFYWDADRGVILKLEWTPAGRAAVEGKEFSYFSPEVDWDSKTQQIIGLIQPGAVGGLVNIPAFQKQNRLAAELSKPNAMPELIKLLIDNGLLPADATEVTPESIAALGERLKVAAAEVMDAKAAATEAKAEATALAAKLAKINDDAAEQFVTEQFKAGRFNEDAKPLWLSRAKEDLPGTQKLLASFKPAPTGHNSAVVLQASLKPGESVLPKVMSKAQFDSLSLIERRDFSVNGGRISD